MTRPGLCLALTLSGVLMIAQSSRAQCTSSADARAVSASILKAAACNYKKLRSGPAVTCNLTPPPACAGTLVTDAVALA